MSAVKPLKTPEETARNILGELVSTELTFLHEMSILYSQLNTSLDFDALELIDDTTLAVLNIRRPLKKDTVLLPAWDQILRAKGIDTQRLKDELVAYVSEMSKKLQVALQDPTSNQDPTLKEVFEAINNNMKPDTAETMLITTVKQPQITDSNAGEIMSLFAGKDLMDSYFKFAKVATVFQISVADEKITFEQQLQADEKITFEQQLQIRTLFSLASMPFQRGPRYELFIKEFQKVLDKLPEDNNAREELLNTPKILKAVKEFTPRMRTIIEKGVQELDNYVRFTDIIKIFCNVFPNNSSDQRKFLLFIQDFILKAGNYDKYIAANPNINDIEDLIIACLDKLVSMQNREEIDPKLENRELYTDLERYVTNLFPEKKEKAAAIFSFIKDQPKYYSLYAAAQGKHESTADKTFAARAKRASRALLQYFSASRHNTSPEATNRDSTRTTSTTASSPSDVSPQQHAPNKTKSP